MAVAFDEPFLVVALDEGRDRPLGVREISKRCSHRHCSFSVRMKRSITPLHCGSPTNDGECWMPSHRSSAPKACAVYCGPQSLRTVSPRATSLPNAAEGVSHALVERLQRRPPIPALGDLPPDELVRPVIDRPEKPAPAIALGPEARRIRAPQLVRAVSRDAPGVRRIAVDVSGTRRRQEAVDPHQPQHPRLADVDAALPQPHAHLAMPFTVKRTRRENRADHRSTTSGITLRRLRPALRRPPARSPLAARRGVHARARHPPDRRTPSAADTACPSMGLRRRLISAASARPPRTPFFRAGVPPARGASSSRRSSPAAAAASRASGSRPRRFSPCWPLSRNTRRHSSSSCTGTWISRATSSMRLTPDEPEHDLHLPLRTPPLGQVVRSLRRHRRLCHWSAPSCPVSRETETAPRDLPVEAHPGFSFGSVVSAYSCMELPHLLLPTTRGGLTFRLDQFSGGRSHAASVTQNRRGRAHYRRSTSRTSCAPAFRRCCAMRGSSTTSTCEAISSTGSTGSACALPGPTRSRSRSESASLSGSERRRSASAVASVERTSRAAIRRTTGSFTRSSDRHAAERGSRPSVG